MIVECIFIITTVLVLMFGIQAIKKFAPTFFDKISKFVPLATFIIAFAASTIFNLIKTQRPELGYAALFGYFIASTEVYTYEGIYKLICKAINFFRKTKDDIKEVVENKKNS